MFQSPKTFLAKFPNKIPTVTLPTSSVPGTYVELKMSTAKQTIYKFNGKKWVMQVFAIFDTKMQDYWKTPKGKTSWGSAGAAKNAWNIHQPSEMRKTVINQYNGRPYLERISFKEQDRFECHQGEFKFDKVKVV